MKNASPTNLLVIDANDEHWQFMKPAIQSCLDSIIPIRVTNPQQAIALLEEWLREDFEAPQLILMDVYLPQAKQGWEFIEQLKDRDSDFQSIPILVLSTSDDQAQITQAYQLGVSSYLIKPIDYAGWQDCLAIIKAYWWETARLPTINRMRL